jgi:PAS domain S-box-containing protein
MTAAPLPADERERLGHALAGAAVDPFLVLVENSHDVVFISSPEMESLYVNPAYERIWGRSRESLAERPTAWMEAIHPDDRQWLQDTAQTSGADSPVEFRLVRPDGSIRWIRSHSFPIHDSQGRLHRLVGFAEDVTERHRTERALLAAKDAAEQASRAKSEFLANMSHELRTPLNAIIGFSEILADGDFGALNQRQAVYVDNVLTGGRQLLELINDLLDLAKIEAERAQLEPADFDLAALIDDLIPSMTPVAEREGICLAVDLEEAMPVVRADPRRIKQVIYNLLSNALKFTPAGGRVTVRAGRRPAAEGVAEPCFRVSIEDTGIGIPPEDQIRLFQVFAQVDSSSTRSKRGTGLGLALSRRLVEMHGGRIWLESAGEGQGTTFFFELPGRTA